MKKPQSMPSTASPVYQEGWQKATTRLSFTACGPGGNKAKMQAFSQGGETDYQHFFHRLPPIALPYSASALNSCGEIENLDSTT